MIILRILWTCGVVGMARVIEDHEASVQIGSGPPRELAEILEAPPWVGEGGNNDIRITPENMW